MVVPLDLPAEMLGFFSYMLRVGHGLTKI
jgi:hypothetical protein